MLCIRRVVQLALALALTLALALANTTTYNTEHTTSSQVFIMPLQTIFKETEQKRALNVNLTRR